MPRQGLTTEEVVAAAADAADEVGYANLTLALLAQRLGVRPPSLYKHVDGLADLQHRIATLAITELGEAVRDAAAGEAGRDALTALPSRSATTERHTPAGTPPPWVRSSTAATTR